MSALLWALLAFTQIARSGIEGFVAKTGELAPQALPNARVELLDGPSAQVLRTDAGGRFAFTDLLPGHYRVLVTKDGFIREEYGPIELKAGNPVKDLGFILLPAPTIAGWVRDEYGEPFPNVLVQAWRRGYDMRGRRIVVPFASTLTDERGIYRLFWLDPGEYIVNGRSSMQSTSGFVTYYPGFPDAADAEAIQLRVGREVGGVDFKTDRGALLRVNGSLLDAANKRPVAGSVTLTVPGDAKSPVRYQSQTDPRGIFTIEGVAPGTYLVSSVAGAYRGSITIVVSRGRDYPGARVELWPPAELKGSLIAAAGVAVDLSQARVTLTSIEPVLPSPLPVGVRDGSFSISGVSPGFYGVAVGGLPGDAYIKDVRYGQNLVLDGSLQIQPGSASLQLQVQLGTDGGQISGTVSDATGHLRAGAQLVLVPDGDRRGRPEQYRLAQSDIQGAFTIRGVASGDYKLFAWEVLEPYSYLNADFIRDYEDRGLPLRIVPNSRASTQVQMIPKD